MALELYNSLSREKEIFIPLDSNRVGLYTCGPTVYNYPHIGNYRAYLFGDILKRVLLKNGYHVHHIMNITDIDDKTIRDSIAQNKSLKEFTEYYTEEFYKDRDMLNIIPADIYTKATDYIAEMVAIIETLLEKGFAYRADDGSVYFDIKKDVEYGKLSHLNLDELKNNAQGRIKKDEYEKENPQDFALWKAWDETDGDVFWETSLGKGRPGWHIECSAMSMKNLGEQFDIHTGGRDNMFPHHENEIAQSECATGKQFVNYWMHNEWLLVDGKKMSKSLNNFYTLRDIIEKSIDPLAFRYLLLTVHYRTPINFTWDSLTASSVALERLNDHYRDLGPIIGDTSIPHLEEFMEAINDDLNTPQALAIVWKLVKDENISHADKKATLNDFDLVLGLGLAHLAEKIEEELPQEIIDLKEKRDLARTEKNWPLSDQLREEIENMGYVVLDKEGETVVKRK
jgi:cysteinyl-tRNA synthetase